MKFTNAERDVVEAMLVSSGWSILQRLLSEDVANTQRKLNQRTTSWDDTNYYRGKLAALEGFQPEALAKRIREARGGSDGN